MARNNYYSVTCSLIFGIIGIVFCQDEARMNESITSVLEYLQIDPDSVSECELVDIDLPERLHKRDLRGAIPMNIKAFGEKIELELQPRDSVLASNNTDVHIAYCRKGNVNDCFYERIENPWEGVGVVYEDPENMASIIFHSAESGERTMNGNFRSPSDNGLLVVRSFPKDIGGEHSNSANHLLVKPKDNNLENYLNDRIEQIQPPTSSDSGIDGDNYPPNINNTNNRIIDTVYPKTLLHLHSSISNNWSKASLQGCLEYILTFWNGVDLIYRDVENPKVRLVIVGIVIAAVPEATPYIWESTHQNNDFYDIVSSSERMLRFYYSVNSIFPVARFDVAITMSKLVGREHSNSSDILGQAGQRGACSRDHVKKKHWGVALVYDNGGYWGISHAAHEFGHLLGLSHDINRTHDCPIQAGFVMQDNFTVSENAVRLSICSRSDLRKSFEGGHLECMYDKPWTTNKILPGSFAGKSIDMEEQCRGLDEGALCLYFQAKADPCTTLWCESKVDRTICKRYDFVIPPGASCEIANSDAPGVCYQNRCVRMRKFL